ncbi:TMV resistance protein N-like [Eucalyptus grandis]|uniref:TMV resistance protein N-like n=1 Tax=Eucalyptus grandis TaxID=71139 RepID=UPI00052415E9|nr:TMV resistance protein N-like [Eucalyptus grandis]
MASSDAGTSWGSEYQVFLSFRGPDTRSGFTDFLYHSLTDAGIRVFREDEELRVGETIDGSLMQAIDNCRIYIPVFSPNYASSQWCLRELSQIVTNTLKSEGNKEILPIFYDVEPDDVRLKTPLYRDALLNLECKKKLRNEQGDAWREALMEVDVIKGWEMKNYYSHGKLEQTVASTFISESNKEILPIYFDDIEHDDVKLKAPPYCDALLNLEPKKKLRNEQVDAWREALMEIDAIKGWEMKNFNGHGELIKLVVGEVVEKLKKQISDSWSICALSKL